MPNMKKGPKLILCGLGVIVVLAALNFAANSGWLGNIFKGSVELKKTATITVDDNEAQQGALSKVVDKLPLPSKDPAHLSTPRMHIQILPWNAQMGFLYAVGGPRTTKGSIAEKKQVNAVVERKDDYGDMQNSLFEFAQALSKGDANPSVGTHFVGIMADGGPAFLAGLNPRLKKLGDEYQAVIVGSFGYSRGEDKLMGPPEWVDNPKLAKGSVCAGVLRDGDWDIAIKWASDNDIKNNPNEKTYDPDAINWIGTSSFGDADEKYVGGYTEDRLVMKNGRKTGETKTVHVDCVVTWTPGDVVVAQKKGGIVPIASTREYSGQMPHGLIGIKKWTRDNPKAVENLLEASFEGADQIARYPEALNFAGEVSNAIYKEPGTSPQYWVKYYKGAKELDKKGLEVELGGSKANNLTDNLFLYGLSEGGANIFAATYNTFGNYQKLNYPDLMPTYPPLDEVLDTSFIKAIAARAPKSDLKESADVANFSGSTGIDRVVSDKSWKINFATGSADFTPDAYIQVEDLMNGLLVAKDLAVQIDGHTDSDGDPAYNRSLSEKRAQAVVNYLHDQSSKNFPLKRFEVHGHGSDVPVASNSTPAGKAQNRRVEIKLGTVAR